MSQKFTIEDRDEILFAFHQACEHPTADQIVEWIKRYPQFADEIRVHALAALESEGDEDVTREADESMLSRAYSNALNIIYKSETEAGAAATQQTFQEIAAARGITVPALSRAIGLPRGIVADLVSGRMTGPIRRVFVDSICRVLQISNDAFSMALSRALARPTLGPAKANGPPSAVTRTYEDIIRSSPDLREEEKQSWIEGE